MKTDLLDLRLGDCMNLLYETEDDAFDLAIVDPPYGIGVDGQREDIRSSSGRGKYHAGKWGRKAHEFKGWDAVAPANEYFEQLFRVSREQLVWGGNYFTQLPPRKGWVIWDKGQRGLTMSDCELCWGSTSRATRIYTLNRMALTQEGTIHPTQKPIKLYSWLLKNYAEPGQRILDTHLGSGSIAIACHYFGAHLTATEIDSDYYADACARVERETRQLALPGLDAAPEPTHAQEALAI